MVGELDMVGNIEGFEVTVGDIVGDTDGDAEGFKDGLNVGDDVSEGIIDGAAVNGSENVVVALHTALLLSSSDSENSNSLP